MTANQIAARANEIEEQRLAETNRHNAATEKEDARHNQEVEAINAEANSIEKKRTNETTRHNATMEYIQLNYNGIYQQYVNGQYSNAKEKLDLEKRLSNLEEQRTLAESTYKLAMAETERQMVALTKRRDEEAARHNSAMEQLSLSQQGIAKEANEIASRRAEYERQYWADLTGIRRSEVQNAFYLGTQNLNYNLDLLNQRKLEYDLQKMKVESEIELNSAKSGEAITSSILQSFGTLSTGLKAMKILSMF